MDENNRNQNNVSGSKRETYSFKNKYTTGEVINEEAELEKASFVSSKKDENEIKTNLKNSLLGHQSEVAK